MAKGLSRRWGAALAELRHASRLSAAEVIKRLKALGLELDRASIYMYEAGKVSAPDAGVVWGLAQVYGVSVTDLIADLVTARNGAPFGDRAKVGQRAAGADVALSEDETDLFQLWHRLSPQQKKASREFILFELSRGASGGQPKGRGRSR
jgi:transcriptional regulator with XRE-family HTH domain